MSLNGEEFLKLLTRLDETVFNSVCTTITGLKDQGPDFQSNLFEQLEPVLEGDTDDFIAFINSNYPVIGLLDVRAQYRRRIQEATKAATPEPAASSQSQGNTFVFYVTDLPTDVSESDLSESFAQLGQVMQVSVAHDAQAISSGIGMDHYAWVTVQTQLDRDQVVQQASSIQCKGQTIQADLSENKSQIYIGNLPKDVSPSEFTEFAKQTVGSFMDLQVKSGFAFVVFPNVQAAEKAIESLKQVEFRGRKLNVDFSQSSSSECRVLYIRNIAEITDEHRLREIFAPFGAIESVSVPREEAGNPRHKGFGFVTFVKADDAARAQKSMNAQVLDGKTIYVMESKPKQEPKQQFQRGGFRDRDRDNHHPHHQQRDFHHQGGRGGGRFSHHHHNNNGNHDHRDNHHHHHGSHRDHSSSSSSSSSAAASANPMGAFPFFDPSAFKDMTPEYAAFMAAAAAAAAGAAGMPPMLGAFGQQQNDRGRERSPRRNSNSNPRSGRSRSRSPVNNRSSSSSSSSSYERRDRYQPRR